MRNALLSLALFGVFASSAMAQQEPDTDVFNGKWNVSIQPAQGRPQTAKLTLVGFGGHWFPAVPAGASKAKSCKAKKMPVTVQVSQAASLEFTVWGAQISPACPDLTIALHPVSEKLLEGTVASGESIRLTRP